MGEVALLLINRIKCRKSNKLRRQKNMLETKEHDETEKELNVTELRYLLDTKF